MLWRLRVQQDAGSSELTVGTLQPLLSLLPVLLEMYSRFQKPHLQAG